MKTSQLCYTNQKWKALKNDALSTNCSLALAFGSKNLLTADAIAHIKHTFPAAQIISCSTAGEINNQGVEDESLVVTAIEFEQTTIKTAICNCGNFANSYETGLQLVKQLSKESLQLVLVFSDGGVVNGDDLVNGINDGFDNKIPIAGGLAGDGTNFAGTLVGLNENCKEGNVVLVGFYGRSLQLDFSRKGGWTQFGPTRTITKSQKNILHEIDGESALDLYKTYLGSYASQLPGSAILFPLALQDGDGGQTVRSILKIDPEQKTMTFAGNVPEGSKVRFMKTTVDSLSNAAYDASEEMQVQEETSTGDSLTLLISCVGRKIILSNRAHEEFDAIRETLGSLTTVAGFYSYGEITPFSSMAKCQMQNQTITITLIKEVA
jgi:hypothetical protein